jgi:uncharacterized protein (DUF39 family)
MEVKKSYEEINEKIKKGEAMILTAEEVKEMAKEQGIKETAKKVDVVTTATFGPMCSSGAFINFGHSDPPIRMTRVWLNDVSAYAGLAAVDVYIGATEVSEMQENYGGAHIIEDLIAGKDIKLRAIGNGTDCYPRKEIETYINKDTLNECFLLNPRNAYQNYSAATNSTDKTIYTYMGILVPNFGNATYSTTGELSPLLNDPKLRTIGIGTRVFLGGAQGFVVWHGTQYNTTTPRSKNGIPIGPAANLCLVGDMKMMSSQFIRAAVFERYGITLFVGVGIPIPLLDEDMAQCLSIRDEDIKTTLCDFGRPGHPVIAQVNYRELKSGRITANGKSIKTGPLSSIYEARKIARILKQWIQDREFSITEPVQRLPENSVFKNLKIRKE